MQEIENKYHLTTSYLAEYTGKCSLEIDILQNQIIEIFSGCIDQSRIIVSEKYGKYFSAGENPNHASICFYITHDYEKAILFSVGFN